MQRSDAGTFNNRYAEVPRRVAAYLADCLLLFLGLLVWQALLYPVNPIAGAIRGGQQPTGGELHLWVFATATIPFLVYFAAMAHARGATVGMRLLKLRVSDESGEPVRLGQSLLRSAVLLVPFELNHAVMFHVIARGSVPTAVFVLASVAVWTVIAVYVAAALVTRRRQSVHDLVARTVVLDTR